MPEAEAAESRSPVATRRRRRAATAGAGRADLERQIGRQIGPAALRHDLSVGSMACSVAARVRGDNSGVVERDTDSRASAS